MPWGRVLRWTGVAVAALLFAGLITLYFLDWNAMRGPVSRYASARTGHPVRIDGDLNVALFRWQPRIDVKGLVIGNPDWVGEARPQAANVRQARIEFRLIPALFGNLILLLVQIDDADLLLVRDAAGRTNWDSDPSKAKSGAAASWHIPPIRDFLIRNGHVEIDDGLRKLKFLGTISSREQTGPDAKNNAFQLTGEGMLNQEKFTAEVHGGPLINVDASKPYAFDADITSGSTHAVLNGNILHPFHLDQLTANVIFKGKNLSDLYYLTGLALPRTPPYTLAAHLERKDAVYTLTDLTGTVGASDLKGNLTVDAGGARPALIGKLTSRVVDFSDLGSVFGGGKTAPPSQAPYLLPDTALHTERLREMDADIEYAAAAIRSRDFPLRGLATHIHLENGVLDLKPLAFSFGQGKLAGSLKVDARHDIPQTSVDARLSDIRIENFIKSAEKPISGTAQARAVLTGLGNSVHKVGATASGTLTAVIPSGQIRHSLAEWLGINVLNALLLSGDNSNTGIRCAVAHFAVKDGVMLSQQFVIDTEPVLVEGRGAINLGREVLDLTLQGSPKHFQIFRLRSPITVRGSLQNPDLGVAAGPAVGQGVVGLGLASMTPLAGILAFLDPGLAENANCAALLSTARAQGTSVRAVPPARKSR